MTTSENINEFAAALAKAQSEMRNATLNKVNPHFRSKYADLSEIRNAVTPALSKHGLAAVQMLRRSEGALEVVTRLVHASGQWVESVFPIPQDVSKPQAMGSAITYGRRYTLAAICNISADEDDDAEAAQEHGKTAPAPVPVAKAYDRNPIVRQAYDELTKGIRMCRDTGTMEDLVLYWKNNQPKIKALPADWLATLEEEKEAAKESLEAKAA